MEIESMANNSIRLGRFTSSETFRLIGNGKRLMTSEELAQRPKSGAGSSSKYIEDESILSDTALELIEECKMEIRLQRSLETEQHSRPTDWGKLAEIYVSEKKLGLDYSINLDTTTVHKIYELWCGTEDCLTSDSVGDIKSPFSLKSFCQLVDAVYVHNLQGIEAMNYIREHHKDGNKYYWQLISNACIHEKKYAELIVFCPLESELESIRQMAHEIGNERYMKFFFALDNELPFIKDGGIYKDITIILFEVPTADKLLLEKKVKEASKLLSAK